MTALAIFDALQAARAARAGTLTKEQWLACVDSLLADEALAKKRKPRRTKADRPRNVLFDALATATGCRDLGKLTRNGAKAVGVALADIREVSPELTATEIERVVEAYRTRHPTWPCTATAIAKHWAEFAATSPTRSSKSDVYIEPAFWSGAAKALYGEDIGGQMAARGWADISPVIRADILRHINKK